MNANLEPFIVTADQGLLADLHAQRHLDTFGLADHAMSLGLRPPGYREGELHSITEVTPPDQRRPSLLVWTAGLSTPAPDDVADDDDEHDDVEVWGDLVTEPEPPVSPRQPRPDQSDPQTRTPGASK